MLINNDDIILQLLNSWFRDSLVKFGQVCDIEHKQTERIGIIPVTRIWNNNKEIIIDKAAHMQQVDTTIIR